MGDLERFPDRQKEAALREECEARMREYRATGKEGAWEADGAIREKPSKPRTAWNSFQAEAKVLMVSEASATWRPMVADEQAVPRPRMGVKKEAEKKMAEYSSSGKAAAWVQKVTELRRAAGRLARGLRRCSALYMDVGCAPQLVRLPCVCDTYASRQERSSRVFGCAAQVLASLARFRRACAFHFERKSLSTRA